MKLNFELIDEYLNNSFSYKNNTTFYENRVDRFTVGLYMKRNNFF